MPTRAEFTALWNNRTMTMEDIAMRWNASRSLVMSWAKRFGLPPRPACRQSKRRYRMPVLVLHPADNHCLAVNDGPGPSDPTPEQIAARAEELRQAHYAQRRAADY
jgi:hypothetical protein